MIARRALLTHAAALVACGYSPLRSIAAAGAMSVRAGVSTVAEPRVLADAVEGATRALRREGALDASSQTTLVVDVLRLDEQTTAPRRDGAALNGRGTTLQLVGRGRSEPGGYDTGELRVTASAADEHDPLGDATRRAETASQLAKSLGETIAMTILGLPTTQGERL